MSAAKPGRWDELDILRGVAGLLMVVNHAGYNWLAPEALADPIVGALVFAGSFAPVVFFTASGIGNGLAAGSNRPADRVALVRKAAILFAADALLWMTPRQLVGLDFLGFIALSMLVLDPLRRVRRPLVWAVAGILAITVARYGLGEAVKSGSGVAQVALGVRAVDGVSYPPLPWLAYALTGFAIGCVARHARAWVDRSVARIVALALVVAAPAAAFAWWLVHGGRAIHRWGFVTLAFYAAGFVAIVAAIVVALVLPRISAAFARRTLELRGVASLALVPWHYLLIHVAGAALPLRQLGPLAYGLAVAAIFAGSVALSRATESATRRLATRPIGPVAATIAGIVAIAVVAKLVLLERAPLVALAFVVVGQVALCVAFTLEPRRRSA